MRFVTVYGDTHGMFRWRKWHRLTTDFVVDVLGRPAG
jgi:hypothetical protein